MKCKHYKGEGYKYKISDEETLYLCDQCNLNLVPETFKQLAVEVFTESLIKRKDIRMKTNNIYY